MEDIAGLRILVVEDEYLVAMAVEATLMSFGCEVVGPHARLPAALAAAEDAALDGAILDVNVAGEEVWPVAEVLARRGIPFVFATGYDGEAVLPGHWRMAPFLKKPFDARLLKRRLAEVCRPSRS